MSSAFHDEIPSVYGPRGRPSFRDPHDGGGVLHDHDVLYDPYDLHHNDAYHDVPFYHDDVLHDRSGDDLLFCDDRPFSRDDRGVCRVYDVSLLYGGHHRSGGPCDIHPYGTSYGSLQFLHLCHGVFCGDVFHPYGDVHAHDAYRDDHVHPSASYDHHHVHDDDRHDDVCDVHHVHLCGDDGVLYDPCDPFRHVHDDDGHDVPCHRLLHDGVLYDDLQQPPGPIRPGRSRGLSKRLKRILKRQGRQASSLLSFYSVTLFKVLPLGLN